MHVTKPVVIRRRVLERYGVTALALPPSISRPCDRAAPRAVQAVMTDLARLPQLHLPLHLAAPRLLQAANKHSAALAYTA